MFLGHFAVALAAKRAAPKVSLGTLVMGAQFVDLLWPVLLLAGVEHVRIVPGLTAVTPLDFYDYPISHSLVGAAVWGVLGGALYYAFRRDRAGAVIIALCVLSHWVLDLATHRPDLPLWPGSSTVVGLGLWNSFFWTVAIEGGLFVAGAALYLQTTTAKDRIGSIGLWAFLVLLAAIYASSILAPPPPSVSAIAVAGNLGWLFVAWGYWIDRHRSLTVKG